MTDDIVLIYQLTTHLVKTNSAGYELTGLLGEANGQGIPLGFFLHKSTDGTAETCAKSRALEAFLAYYAKKCPRVRFTLSDKEIEEIKALHTCFPKAKIIICYWHLIRTVEGRLAENTAPAYYDSRDAYAEFSFIDPEWAPGVIGARDAVKHDAQSGSVHPQRGPSGEVELKAEEEVRLNVATLEG